MGIYVQTDRDGIARHFVQGLESWDDFAAIVSKVLQSLSSTIVQQGDGPDARLCIVLVEGYEITFAYDDMLGNFFYSRDKDAGGVIRSISALFSD
jgi:hypothetical protein